MARMRMEVKQCSKGHFYSGEYGSCPFCSGGMDSGIKGTEYNAPPVVDDISVTEPMDPTKTNRPQKFEMDDYDPTMAAGLEMDTMGCDPVVGWLVCTKGPNRGKAYRLHNGTNFIGRGANMDVCIEKDIQISAQNAASISYDDRTKVFFLERGDVRNNVYLNGAVLRSSEDVVRFDKIAIGGSEFLFVPLCGDRFDWQTELEKDTF